ncbi:N-acetylhexosaminidase [Vararia minispora EC-137]|uniref:N-acetylhexosaminidase n=1 Tax=Vararia minispora EC-137 TaxID=1314806 RepID=A0ACB8QWE3_9AGAM|nr:N-acetylhexosaminidase [Vararia minispora EC-137]
MGAIVSVRVDMVVDTKDVRDALASVVAPAFALWPQQRNLQTGSSALKLAPSFHITTTIHNAPEDLHDAVLRTLEFLKMDKLGRLVVGRGSGDATVVSRARTLSSLTLSLSEGSEINSIATEVRKALEDRDEAYTLHVPADGSDATMTANTTLGLFRGLATFSQMWYTNDEDTYTINAPFSIQDSPVYPYRGLLLDTARNFFPVSDIKRMLDVMSWVKMSVLHWHVVDSQSFPLEIPGFINISRLGAYSPSSIYSTLDVEDIVHYAGARGIDVLMELDNPGHTTIIHKAFPEHVACPEATPWATYASEPPAGQLRFALPGTANFVADFLAAAARMSPSKYFSTGGDELNTACYDQDAPTQKQLNATGKTFSEALSDFITTTHGALVAQGKTPVVSEPLLNETLVKVWISSENVAAVVRKGFKVIHAASDYFYLDCGAGEWIGADPDANSWCDPFKSWQKSYSFDPTANLTDTEAALIQGGEHSLWGEQSGPENVDSITWPRAASSAELFWSGPGGNGSTALPRLHDVAYRMRTRGVKAIRVQPEWCALRPGKCDLTS